MRLRGLKALIAGLIVLVLIGLFFLIVLNIIIMLIPIVLIIVIGIFLYRYFSAKIMPEEKFRPKKAHKKDEGVIDAEFKIKD